MAKDTCKKGTARKGKHTDTNLIHATVAYAHFSLKPPYLENTFNSAIKHPQQTHAAIWITCHAAQLQRITNPSQSFEEI